MTRKELASEIAQTLYNYDCLDVGNFGTDIDCLDSVSKLIVDILSIKNLTILDTDYLQSFIEEHLVK